MLPSSFKAFTQRLRCPSHLPQLQSPRHHRLSSLRPGCRPFSLSSAPFAGHSHYANIKHKKDRTDREKAAAYGKFARSIKAAAKIGGPNPKENPHLQTYIDKAKAVGMSKTKIDQAIKSASGTGAEAIENVIFECKAPGKVSLLVFASTDNKNRVSQSVHNVFKKIGGPGISSGGTALYLFSKAGVMQFKVDGRTEDEVFDILVNAGIEDFNYIEDNKDVIEIRTDGNQMYSTQKYLEEKGLVNLVADFVYTPQNLVEFDSQETKDLFSKVLAALESTDDIVEVVHNADMDQDFEEE